MRAKTERKPRWIRVATALDPYWHRFEMTLGQGDALRTCTFDGVAIIKLRKLAQLEKGAGTEAGFSKHEMARKTRTADTVKTKPPSIPCITPHFKTLYSDNLRRCMMSNSSLLADKVVFCGKTSLEIAHSFNDANTNATRSSLSAPPKHSPPDLVLEQLAGRPSATTPPIRFSFPAHLLFHGDVRHKQTLLRIPHRCTNIPKGRHFLKVSKNVYAASANFALCQMADEAKEMFDLLLLLWEACGTYRTDLTWMEGAYETVPLTSVRSLSRFMSENPKIHGAGKIQRVLRYVRDGSASVRETQIALFFGLPTRYGGFNLGLPQMNHRVDASQEARLIGGRSHFRCDLCWPDQKIDIEYQSDESHEGKLMRIKDSRRTNALISMGWHVFNVTNNEAQSLTTIERIAEHVRVLLRKRSHPVTREMSIKRLHLHRRLGIARDDLTLPSSFQQ